MSIAPASATIAVAAAIALGSFAAARPAHGATPLEPGTEINATLDKSIDAGLISVGHEVTARVMHDVKRGDTVVVRKGSKLVGRVTRAVQRMSNTAAGTISASELDITFDRVIGRNGDTIAIEGSIGAVAAGPSSGKTRQLEIGGSSSGPLTAKRGGIIGSGAGGTMTGKRSASTGVGEKGDDNTDADARSVGAVGGLDDAGRLTSGSRGVFGIEDLELAPSATRGVAGPVFVSRQNNVRLSKGSQLLVVCAPGEADAG